MLTTACALVFFLSAGIQDYLYLIPEEPDLQRSTEDVLAYRGNGQMVYLGTEYSGFELLDTEPGCLENYFIVLPELLPPGWDLSEYGDALFFDGYVYITKPGEDSPSRICAAARPLRPVLPVRTVAANYPQPVYDSDVINIVNSVNQDSLISIVGRLEQFESRFWSNDSFPAARDWAAAWLENEGCAVEVQSFPMSSGISQNLIVTFPGTIHPDQYVLLGAHLDSGRNGQDIFPGADDNASGSAAVMEAARAMVPYEFQNTVVLCLWGAEEAGTVGSYYYASNAAAAGEEIIAVLNTDMILYGPSIGPISYDILNLDYNDNSLALAQYFSNVSDIYVPQLEVAYNYTTYGVSDYVSFWQCGFTAIGGNEIVYPPWYHTAYDQLENYVEFFPFGTNVAKATTATLASLAVPTGTGIAVDTPAEILDATPSVAAWPCPASRTVQVSVSGMNQNPVLSLFDLSGRCVQAYDTFSEYPVSLDLSGFSCGMYLLLATTSTQTASARVLLVR